MKTLSSFLIAIALLLQVVFTGAQGQVWQARHGMTSSAFQTQFSEFVDQGYRLTHVDGYGINNAPLYAAIWEKTSGPAWVAKHGLTDPQYQTQFDTLIKSGYRPTKVSGYTVSGSARYAAIWEKSSGPAWAARHGLTSAQYQSAFNTYISQGYRLKHISGYAVGTSARYAAIWEKSSGPAFAARHGLTVEKFQKEFDALVAKGYRLLLVDGYTVNGTNLYAGIWEKSTGPAWESRGELTPAQFQTAFNQFVKQGYKLVSVSGYGTTTARYAAIWSKKKSL
ncbi:hypothetical protein BG011_003501 [Mortierella polycephala]|uniref:Uncharacterized protein n=1 Tax=Mortierella polycephala TaxID=41804 RepID=A0A9P6U3X4_9FUNG|nr:hypothetical protein BG011_003501 [Mortierella polycephala]